MAEAVREADARAAAAAAIRAAFVRAADALGLTQRGRTPVIEDLLARLAEPHRRYHDSRHVAACVSLAEAHASHAARPAEVVVALLFHDAVYDPSARDNEARSAALAVTALAGLGADEGVVARVERLVLATRDHEARGDRDAALVLDCDLSILGADAEAREAFEEGVRAEYAFVEDSAYRVGRARVLEAFLAKERIYAVPAIAAQLEAPARAHLAARLRALRTGEGDLGAR
jgi:predicted metal-dependent HD superfamily phosphohydrolase